jgi:CBS domain-containing protein
MFVREILARKGRDVKRIGADQSLEVAAALLRLERIGALVVCGEEDRLLGLFSEKDVVRAVVDCGPRALKLPVADFMDDRPVTCEPEDSVAKVARLMTLHRARHLPVLDDNRISGIVSIGDIVRDRLEEMELERDTLRDLALSHRLAG